jgi:hypothetical protein
VQDENVNKANRKNSEKEEAQAHSKKSSGQTKGNQQSAKKGLTERVGDWVCS